MFDGRTVLILGAGTSADFGLPLGDGLWSRVRDGADAYQEAARQLSKKHPSGTQEALFGVLRENARRDDPKGFAFLCSLDGCVLDGQPLSVRRFQELIMANNVHGSVDDFVKDNVSVSGPISALVAGSLFEAMYENKGGGLWKRRDDLFASEFTHPQTREPAQNWIRRFVGFCRAKLATGWYGRLTVISFNYDRLFETIAREVWDKSEVKYRSFDECIEVIYPYGVFARLDVEIPDSNEFLTNQRSAFALAGTRASAAAHAARRKVQEANRIFFCGFSCAESAIALLGLEETSAMIIAQNFEDQDLRLDRILRKRFKVPGDRIEDDDMSTLVRSGFFEIGEDNEPPARPTRF
jgi:hypothetical protein